MIRRKFGTWYIDMVHGTWYRVHGYGTGARYGGREDGGERDGRCMGGDGDGEERWRGADGRRMGGDGAREDGAGEGRWGARREACDGVDGWGRKTRLPSRSPPSFSRPTRPSSTKATIL